MYMRAVNLFCTGSSGWHLDESKGVSPAKGHLAGAMVGQGAIGLMAGGTKDVTIAVR
jgi:hypothetical protein